MKFIKDSNLSLSLCVCVWCTIAQEFPHSTKSYHSTVPHLEVHLRQVFQLCLIFSKLPVGATWFRLWLQRCVSVSSVFILRSLLWITIRGSIEWLADLVYLSKLVHTQVILVTRCVDCTRLNSRVSVHPAILLTKHHHIDVLSIWWW